MLVQQIIDTCLLRELESEARKGRCFERLNRVTFLSDPRGGRPDGVPLIVQAAQNRG